MFLAAALCLQFGTFGQGSGMGVELRNIFVWKRGAMSQSADQATYVIKNEGEFRRYWARNQVGNVPTDMDWLKQMVVAVHLGNRPNPSYELELGSTEVKNSKIWLHMRERLPSETGMVAQVRTSPWMLVRLDKTAWDIRTDFVKLPSRDNGVLNADGSTTYRWGGTTVIVPPSNQGFNDLGWGSYYGGFDCGRDEEGYLVFDSGDDLRRYWNRNLRLDESLAPQTIDWQSERVVAIHLGRRPGSGFRPSVVGIRREGNRAVIVVKEVAPQSIEKGTPTRPYLLVRVDRSVKDYRVQFQK